MFFKTTGVLVPDSLIHELCLLSPQKELSVTFCPLHFIVFSSHRKLSEMLENVIKVTANNTPFCIINCIHTCEAKKLLPTPQLPEKRSHLFIKRYFVGNKELSKF